MQTIVFSQFALGAGVGLTAWFIVYVANRAWLAFWSFMR